MALSALVTALWIFSASSPAPATRLGMSIFSGLTVLSTVFVLAAGPRSTSDCLSEEKREGTLGLLFLTDLKGYDIVLGKLTSSSVNSIYGLLSVIPILAIPLLMGGVSFRLFWQVILALANGLFFSLAAAIFVSSFSRNDRSAAGISLALILGFSLGSIIVPSLANEALDMQWGRETIMVFALFSPICPLANAFGIWFGGMPGTYYWISLAATHCFGWFFIGLACRIAPRSWQDKPGGASARSWRERLARWTYGSEKWRLANRKALLDANAFQWLASRNRLRKMLLKAVLGCEMGAILYFVFRFGNDAVTLPASIFIALSLNATLKLWVASESCRQMIDERRQNSLELILSTPMTVGEIMEGQRRAMHGLFAMPVILVLIVECVLLLCSVSATDGSDKAMCIAVFLCGMAALVADCSALVWVGMWLGLSTKNSKRASGGAAWRILVLPTLAWIVLVAGMRGGSPEAALTLWIFFGLGADAFFGFWAYSRLQTEFRQFAMARYQPQQPGFFRWLRPGDDPSK
jgi:hypothetical protein